VIVVDTSALMAILQEEAEASFCKECLVLSAELLISAGTLAEALIVAGRRGVRADMERMIQGLGMEVVPVTPAFARSVADAYERWGKGISKAGLNFGDCFAYALAQEKDCPLLFVGNDFVHTNVRRVEA